MTLLNEKVPGKLYIIGEYNVLKSGHSAILAPVNLFLQGSLLPNHKTTIIENNIAYPFNDLLINCPHQLKNTVATILFFNEFIEHQGLAKKDFHYTINNNLINDNQQKYGLGSSAASVVLTLKLLNQLYHTNLDDLTLFKMAVIVQLRQKDFSSGGDLACIIFDKPIYYTRYDLEWLLNQSDHFQLLTSPWPLLKIEVLHSLPSFLIGWTKETSTPDIKNGIEPSFYDKAELLVNEYLHSFDASILTKYQLLINEIAIGRPGLLTAKLESLIRSAAAHGVAAKISGAGYGDCGIAQLNNETCIECITKFWEKEDIEVLNIWRNFNV